MKVYIGNRSEYSTFSLIQKAYWISYKCSITESCIIKNQQGKPYFRDLSKPFFNVSHSGQYIGCVFDTDEVGLDIQKIRKLPDITVKRYLYTESSNPVEQTVEWTRFESFGKMKGTGIPPEEDYKQAVFITTLALDGYVITVSVTKEKNQDIELNFV